MSLISRRLLQTAVYWPPLARDSFGQRTYDTPIEIACRWEERAVEFLDPRGETQVSNAVVGVDRALVLGGLLHFSSLADLTSETEPRDNTGVWEIRQLSAVPNFRATETLYEAFL